MKNLDPVRAQISILQHCKAKRAELNELETAARAAVETLMGDDETGMLDGEPVIRWPHLKQRRFDQKALKENEPDLVEQYTRTIEQRRFEIL